MKHSNNKDLSSEAKWHMTKFMAQILVSGWVIISVFGYYMMDASRESAISEAKEVALIEANRIFADSKPKLDGLRNEVQKTVTEAIRAKVASEDAVEDAEGVRESYRKLALELKSAEDTRDLIKALVDQPDSIALKLKNDVKFLELVANKIPKFPTGTIVAYWGKVENGTTLEREGWLLCNGQPIRQESKFKDLIDLVGKETPDLRGMFLRGLDSRNSGGHSGIDPDRPRTIGSVQESVNMEHLHYMFANKTRNLSLDVNQLTESASVMKAAQIGNDSRNYQLTKTDISPTLGQTSKSGSSESRPINVAVNYIIKY